MHLVLLPDAELFIFPSALRKMEAAGLGLCSALKLRGKGGSGLGAARGSSCPPQGLASSQPRLQPAEGLQK